MFDESFPSRATSRASIKYSDATGRPVAMLTPQQGDKVATITIGDYDKHQPLRTISLPATKEDSRIDLAVSPDGKHISATFRQSKPDLGGAYNLRIWDASTGDVVANAPLGDERLQRIQYSPDGNFIAQAYALRDVVGLDCV